MARALDIAMFILANAEKLGRPISNLKLQKILFFVHRDYLGKYREKLITDKEFEAWHYGAVIPRVYREYVLHCANPIVDQPLPTLDLKEDRIAFLKDKIAHYTLQKPWDLVALAHEPNNAWSRVYDERKKNVIPHEYILEEASFVRKIEESKEPISLFERILWVLFFAYVFWKLVNIPDIANNSIVVAFLEGLGVV